MTATLSQEYERRTRILPRPEILKTGHGTRRRLRGVLRPTDPTRAAVYVLYELVETGERYLLAAANWTTAEPTAESKLAAHAFLPLPGTHWRRGTQSCCICCVASDHLTGEPYVVYVWDDPAGVFEMRPLTAWQRTGRDPVEFVPVS